MRHNTIWHFLFLGFLVLFFCSAVILERTEARGQSSDLETIMKFLQDELSSLGTINGTYRWTNEVTGRRGVTYAVFEITEFHADASSCNISYTLTNPNAAVGDDLSFDLKDVETVRELTAEEYLKELHTASGHPEMDNISDPPQFVVVVKLANASRSREFWLLDEDLASRVAAALNRAVILCGGDSEQSSPYTSAGQSAQDALASHNGSAPNVSVYNTTTQPRPNAQVAQYVRGVPQCGHSQYGNGSNAGNFYLINTCNIKVTITFTNSGNGLAWGTTSVAPGERQLTESMGNAGPRDNGLISLYTCPGDSLPVLPDGRQFPGHNYHGPYTCYAGTGFSPN